MPVKLIKKVKQMVLVLNHIIDKLDAWQILLVLLVIFTMLGAIIILVLINRVRIKLCGILEINAKE